jgi:CheY-like chemotaxis protein
MAKILVVDDDELMRDLICALLESKGHSVVDADNGDTAVNMARTELPDLIILDMNMPGMTGWETIPVIRSHPDTRDIPIVAVTGDSSTGGRDEAHLAGVDRYVTKPIVPDRLFATLDEILLT